MGWTIPFNSLVSNQANLERDNFNATNGGNATGIATLPPAVRNGDDVWVIVATTAPITPPAGYTIVGTVGGVALNGAGSLGVQPNVAVYRHTWLTGDTLTPQWTVAGTFWFSAFIVRTTGTTAIQTDAQAFGNSAVMTIKAALPAKDGDLRLVIMNMATYVSAVNWQAVPTATDQNPSRQRYLGYGPNSANGTYWVDLGFNQIAKGNCGIDLSVWRDDTTDLADSTVAIANQKWFSRTITLTDGTSVNGTTVDDVEPSTAQFGFPVQPVFGGGAEIF